MNEIVWCASHLPRQFLDPVFGVVDLVDLDWSRDRTSPSSHYNRSKIVRMPSEHLEASVPTPTFFLGTVAPILLGVLCIYLTAKLFTGGNKSEGSLIPTQITYM